MEKFERRRKAAELLDLSLKIRDKALKLLDQDSNGEDSSS